MKPGQKWWLLLLAVPSLLAFNEPEPLTTELPDGDQDMASAQAAYAAASNEPSALRALATIVNLHRRRGDYAEGLAGASEGLTRAQNIHDLAIQVEFLYLQGRIYWNLTDYPRSLEVHLTELGLAQQLGDPFILARTHGGLGLTYQRYERDEDALHHFHLGLAEAARAPDNRMRGSLLNSLGNYHLTRGDHARAEGLYEEALRIRVASGNSRAIAETLTNLGLVADARGEYEFALWFAIAAPLVLVLLWLVPGGRPSVVRLAPWAALPAWLLALVGPTGKSVELGWIMLGTRLGLDATGQVFLYFTALLWGVCGAFGRAYLADDPVRERFFLFHLLAMSGNFGLILALDAPGFYACFALMSFSSYGLVIHQRSPEALRAGRIYLYLVVLGELMLFAALVLICASAASTRLPVAAGSEISSLAFGLVVAGFGIKAGLLPLHVWLPLAHPVAPTPASAVLSGAMIKAGLIGWLRFLPLGQSTVPACGGLLAVLGMSAAFFGVLAGLAQRNPKTVLAYSSISQMGLITLGVGASLLSPENGSAFQGAVLLLALHHGLAKGALFLGVGVAQAAGARHRAWVGVGLLLPALALAGAPWTSGALAKTALKSATGALPPAWADALAVLLPLAAIGTTLLMARFLILAWPRESDEGHLNAGLVVPWGLLLAAVALTFYLWSVVVQPAGIGSDPSAAWTAAWPVLVGAVLGLSGWKWGRGWSSRVPIPAGDLLALVEAAASWLRCYSPALATTATDPAAPHSAGKVPGWLATGNRLASQLRRGEAGMQRWSVSGVVFLSIGATLVLLLVAIG